MDEDKFRCRRHFEQYTSYTIHDIDTLTESDAFFSGTKQKAAQPYRCPRGLSFG